MLVPAPPSPRPRRCAVTGHDLGAPAREEMLRYLENHQQMDGGWGLHIEAPSTIFGTVLNYVAARILGLSAGAPMAEAARGFIRSHGGAVGVPHWGKFWLATYGLYEWDGLNPIPPELFLLPYAFPLHPGRMWCHCRMVYLPMSYVYGGRYTATITPLQEALRREIYVTPYAEIPWSTLRNVCCDLDLYSAHTRLCNFAFAVMKRLEPYTPKAAHDAAMAFTLSYIEAEDVQTNWVDIGPVNKVLNMLAVWYARGSGSEGFRRHAARVVDYLWVAEDGSQRAREACV